MEGTATCTDGVLSVQLEPLVSVLRLEMTLPENFAELKAEYIRLDSYDEEENDYPFTTNNQWYYYFEGEAAPLADNECWMYLGAWSENVQKCLVPASKVFVAYVPFMPGEGAIFGPSGGKSLEVELGVRLNNLVKTKTFTKDTPLEPGKMYRLKVDFTE